MRTAPESVHLIAATAGFISLGALWLGMLFGTTLRSGWAISRVRQSTIHGLHTHMVLFGLWLGLVHAVAQLAVPPPHGKVGWIDELLPFANDHDPIGIGMGVLALELMISFVLSVLVQRKLGYHRWRTLHSLAYFAFTLAVGHVLVSGTDLNVVGWVRLVIVLGWAIAMGAGIATFPGVAKLPRKLLDRYSGQARASDVTVNVDATRCARFGFCEHEAPSIFSLRSDGRLAYRSAVPAEQADAAMQAAMVCPARAISLGRLPTSMVMPPPPPDRPPAETVAVPGPPRSPLEDTGRHHLRPIRPVGRPSGGSR